MSEIAAVFRKSDGDLRADTKEPVTDAYGRLEIDPQNNANALDWSLDNWMHMAGQVEIALVPHVDDATGRLGGCRALPLSHWERG